MGKSNEDGNRDPWRRVEEDGKRALEAGRQVREIVMARTGNAKLARAAGKIAEDIYLALIDLDWRTIGTIGMGMLAATAMRAGEIAGCPRKIKIKGKIPLHLIEDIIEDMRIELSWILEKLPTVLDRGQLCHLIDHLEDAIYGMPYGKVLNIH